MAKVKAAKYLKLLEKNKDGSYKKVLLNNDGSRGRVKFKILGLPKEFFTSMEPIADANDTLERLAENIKRLENCGRDETAKEPAAVFPFSPRQIKSITDTGYSLDKKIIQAFTQSMTFKELYAERCVKYLRWTPQIAADFLIDDLPSTRSTVCFPINKIQMSWIEFADTEISLIEPEQLRDLFGDIDKKWTHAHYENQSLSQATVSKLQASIKAVFKYAKQSNNLANNPFDGDLEMINENRVTKGSRGKKHYWCPVQQQFIFQAAADLDAEYIRWSERESAGKSATNACYELFLRFGVCTGARMEDLSEARWSEFANVEHDYMSWTFIQRKHKMKRGFKNQADENPYAVTINDFHMYPELLALLKAAYANRKTEFVFEKIDGSAQASRNTISGNFKKVMKAANDNVIQCGINDRVDMDMNEKPIKVISGSPHKMRHTMVSNQVSGSNGNWDAASKRAGHADVSITLNHYGDMMSEEVENAWEQSAKAVALKSKAALERIRRIKRGLLKIVK